MSALCRCTTTAAFLIMMFASSLSTADGALANSTETRTWKYIGYYVSKIRGAAVLKLNAFGIPVVNIPSNNPAAPFPFLQINPPQQVPSPFIISPDTAAFPDFPGITDALQPSTINIPMFVTPSPSDSLTPSPTVGAPPPPAADESNTIDLDTPDLLPRPSIGPPEEPQDNILPFPGSLESSSPLPFPTAPTTSISSPPASSIGPPPQPQGNILPFSSSPPSASPLPFPTAPPSSASSPPAVMFAPATTASGLPTGLTSGTFLSPNLIPVAQVNILPPTGTVQCGCVTAGTCVTQAGAGGVISVRIVTQTPSVTCAAGQQYCCTQSGVAPQPQQSTCGIPNVIQGVFPSANQANFGEFPWSGIILTAQNQYIGGAALIDNTHLLTAAHVVANLGNGAGLKVRLGEWDLTATYEPNQFVDIPILSIASHPNFVASTLQNDIALITLQAPATLVANPTPQVNTVCLPAATDDFTGQTCFVAGWGKDSFTGNYQNIIKKVDVPVVGNADCQQRLRQTRLGPQWSLDTTSFVCAGGVVSKDACQGDGGNALVCLKAGRFVVEGITAGGVECGRSNVPGLYVRVGSYLNWIATQMAGTGLAPIQATGGIDPRRQG